MSKVRFGVIGCGFIGAAEAKAIHEREEAEVVAVTGGRGGTAEKLAAELGCDCEADFTSLVKRDDIDAVIVATPNHLHVEPVVAAAGAGKHIFLEKPMALSTADCDRMIEACERNGIIFMLGTMMHYYEGFVRIKRMIDQGEIGKPMIAFAARTGWEPRQEKVSWKKQQAYSGGHLFHHIHEIDLLRWFMGDVKEVFARASNFFHVGEGYGDEDDVLLLNMEFKSGGFGTMEYGSGFRIGGHVVTINGSLGGFHIDNARSEIVFRREGQPDTLFSIFDDEKANQSLIDLFREADGGVVYGRPGDPPRYYLIRAIKKELDSFVRKVSGGEVGEDEAWLFDPYQGRAAVAVAEAALKSARTGKPVEVS